MSAAVSTKANSCEPITRSLDEMLLAFDRGEITDAKTIAGLFILDRERR